MKHRPRFDTNVLIAHGLLWGLYLLPPLPYYLERMSMGQSLLTVGLSGTFLGVFVYANLFYFIPQFFEKGQRLLYLGVTLLIGLLYAWAGKWALEQLIHQEQPPVFYSITRFFSLTFAFGFINQYVHQQQTRHRLLQLESQQTRLELEQLKAQVNPHFLFNTLHNLYSLTLKQSPQAPDVVLRLASLMRYFFTTAHLDTVPLAQEVAYLDHYLELERLRLSSHRAVIRFDQQGPLDTVELPPMLLIPFVENAFKHGVATDTGYVSVVVTLAVQDREVFFEVVNSKPAVNPTAELADPGPGGTGLRNVQQRLALLFPNRHRLTVDNQPLIHRITLALHL